MMVTNLRQTPTSAFDRFPRVVEHIQELEPMEQHALEKVCGAGAFDFIARFPPFDLTLSEYVRARRRNTRAEASLSPQVWAQQGNRFFVLQHVSGAARVQVIARDDILTFELGEVLLHDWLELVYAHADETRVVHVDFNAAGLDWLKPLVSSLRQRVQNTDSEAASIFEASSAPLAYKWQTILQIETKVFNETAMLCAFEPSAPRRWFWQNGREGKLVLLMPQHIVVAREPLEIYPYGWITKSCVRSQIRDARVLLTEQSAILELTLGARALKIPIELPRAHAETLTRMANALVIKPLERA